jgi:hypothetical protein
MLNRITKISWLALALAVVCLVALTGTAGRPACSMAKVRAPYLLLWAWERPESISFVNSKEIGVAFLAESIFLDRQPVLRPRLQPLRVGPKTPLTAVVRLEITPRTPKAFDPSYTSTVAQWIVTVAHEPQVEAVQIDFDATQSQRDFYRALLAAVRPLLPTGMQLSITALGSWCLGDDWLSGLPIDEAVPMLFRMGVDRENILHALAAGDDFREPLCRTSLGVSTDEPWPEIPDQPFSAKNWWAGRRVYVFNPHPWTKASFEAIQRKLTP